MKADPLRHGGAILRRTKDVPDAPTQDLKSSHPWVYLRAFYHKGKYTLSTRFAAPRHSQHYQCDSLSRLWV